jgi:outer membrane protein assembly factor BamB
LIAYVHAGAIVWQQKLGPFQDEYGAPSSPIIVDDKVILNQDHDVDNALYAFHRVDGRIVWQIPRDDFTRSYSTPAVLRRNGRSEIVVAGSLQLAAYDSERGEKLWWVDGLARIVNPVPVVADEWIYVAGWTPGGDSGQRIKMEPWRETVQQFDANGDGKISRHELVDGEVLTRFFRIDVNQDQMLSQAEWERHAVVFDRARNSILAVRPAGIGDLTASSIRWEYDRGIPYVPSPLLYQDIVYMVKDGGILTSLASRTGEPLKQARLQTAGSYYASPAAGDGKIYLASESGVVTVVRADGQWQIISTHDFGEPIYATPVIRDGRVYVRTAAALYCFGRK